jgi:hypothetical protein
LGRIRPKGGFLLWWWYFDDVSLSGYQWNFLNATIEQLAIINKGDSLFYPRQGINVQLKVLDPPQGIPFLDHVLLFAINGHVEGHAPDQVPINGLCRLANGVSLAKKRLEIRAHLDSGRLPDRQESDQQTDGYH